MLDATQIAMNEFILEEIVRDEIPEKYFSTDSGNTLIASNVFETEKTVQQLVSFVFPNSPGPFEVYRKDHSIVLDLSPLRKHLIGFDELDSFYPNWILTTGRKNTMDEYGMLIDYIGHANQTTQKKYLFMVISQRQSIPSAQM